MMMMMNITGIITADKQTTSCNIPAGHETFRWQLKANTHTNTCKQLTYNHKQGFLAQICHFQREEILEPKPRPPVTR